MGLLSTSTKIQNTNHAHISRSNTLLFLNPNHYFQNWNHSIHLALRTGLCGCITTFASWNTQMVLMISSGDVNLILSAIFGYVLGVHCSYISLKFGQHFSLFIHNRNNESVIHLQDEMNELKREEKEKSNKLLEIFHLVVPYVMIILILTHFIVNEHRYIWLSTLFAPIGTIIRWRLSVSFNKLKSTKIIQYHGTFYANIIGSILSILSVSFLLASTTTSSPSIKDDILKAIKLGLAGCLSTVSTFMDECDTLLCNVEKKKHVAYSYVYGTICTACLSCIIIYVPISLTYS